MTDTHQLTFAWSAWTLAISVVVVAVTAVFGFVAWRRSDYRKSIGILELCRLLLVLLTAVILNQPEWVEQFRPDEKPTIAVLWDDSASMNTRDVLQPNQTSSQPISRHDALAPLLSTETWKPLAERFQVVIQPFSTAQTGHGTNLHDPLADAPEKFKNLSGIVLASDGDWNEGLPPVSAAAQLRLKNIPVLAVPVGSAVLARHCSPQSRCTHFRRRRQVCPNSVHDRKLIAPRIRHHGHAPYIQRR